MVAKPEVMPMFGCRLRMALRRADGSSSVALIYSIMPAVAAKMSPKRCWGIVRTTKRYATNAPTGSAIAATVVYDIALTRFFVAA